MGLISVLARKTQGDERFYTRWEALGELVSSRNEYEADIIIVDQHTRLSDSIINQYRNLKYVCSPTTGHTHLKFDATKRDIKLVTLRGETAFLSQVRSVSEFTFQLIHKLLSPPFTDPRRTLAGKTLGIVGLGRIGTHVKEIAKSYKMRLLSVDKESPKVGWAYLFSESDIVSIHLSEDDTTRGIINKDLLNCMREGSYFINTARGSIVDEDELLRIVNNRHIQAAAVDVACDPDKLNSCPFIYVSPHIAGHTLEDRIRTDEFLVGKLKKLMVNE